MRARGQGFQDDELLVMIRVGGRRMIDQIVEQFGQILAGDADWIG